MKHLNQLTLFFAEDTRHTKKLFSRYEISTPLISCHKFNEAKKSKEIIAKINNDKSIALVTDSGMPCISDPGSRVIQICRESNIPISMSTRTNSFNLQYHLQDAVNQALFFMDFFPIKEAGRKKIIEKYKNYSVPIIFYESPYRLLKLLKQVCEVLGEKTFVYVCRELTKKFEETLEGTSQEILEALGDRPIKGEIVVIVMPNK